MILSYALILPISLLQTQKLKTTKIRPHSIFYTNLLYSCAHFIVKNDENVVLMTVLIRRNDDSLE